MNQLAPSNIVERTYSMIIDGQPVHALSGEMFATIDPATGQVIAEVPRGSKADVDRAVEVAEAAFRSGPWRDLKPFERGRMVHTLGEILLKNLDEMAALESLDTGKPLRQATTDIRVSARYLEYYAGLADKVEGTRTSLGVGKFAASSREPYGVVGIIVPWNSPINQAARSLAPALAGGNTAVIKPAENTPLSAIRLAELALEAGIPPGVVNVVTGYGDEAGHALADHPLVQKISFTGSVATGIHVARVAAERIVPSSLELGGKSACLVFEDADLSAVVDSMISTVTQNAGQVCSAATRVVVEAPVVDTLLEMASERMASLTVGHGLTDPMLGPVVSEPQMNRILDLISHGQGEGARVVTGGGRFDDPELASGFFVEPTVLRDVAEDMRVAQEEIFGPVISTLSFSSEDEAIAIANGTEYGLAAGVYTKDFSRAMRVSESLEAGQVFVNEYLSGGVETPFGGYKKSGWGREKGLEAIRDYTQLRTVIYSF